MASLGNVLGHGGSRPGPSYGNAPSPQPWTGTCKVDVGAKLDACDEGVKVWVGEDYKIDKRDDYIVITPTYGGKKPGHGGQDGYGNGRDRSYSRGRSLSRGRPGYQAPGNNGKPPVKGGDYGNGKDRDYSRSPSRGRPGYGGPVKTPVKGGDYNNGKPPVKGGDYGNGKDRDYSRSPSRGRPGYGGVKPPVKGGDYGHGKPPVKGPGYKTPGHNKPGHGGKKNPPPQCAKPTVSLNLLDTVDLKVFSEKDIGIFANLLGLDLNIVLGGTVGNALSKILNGVGNTVGDLIGGTLGLGKPQGGSKGKLEKARGKFDRDFDVRCGKKIDEKKHRAQKCPAKDLDECVKRCESDALEVSVELGQIFDCAAVSLSRGIEVDNCLYVVDTKVLDVDIDLFTNGDADSLVLKK